MPLKIFSMYFLSTSLYLLISLETSLTNLSLKSPDFIRKYNIFILLRFIIFFKH